MKQFNVAANAFYGSQVAEPTRVYNKIGEGKYDATPYAIK